MVLGVKGGEYFEGGFGFLVGKKRSLGSKFFRFERMMLAAVPLELNQFHRLEVSFWLF
jgi:hypothetical protein